VIDVSQSVEHDHPHALEFLRKDVFNVLEFFRKKLTDQIMTVRELFEFVVSDLSSIQEKLQRPDLMVEQEILDAYLDDMDAIIKLRPADYLEDAQIQSNDQVFQNVYIPRTLDEVEDHEGDVAKIRKGENPDLLYQAVTGLEVSTTEVEVLLDTEDDSSNEGTDDDGSDSQSEREFQVKRSTLKKNEDPEVKKERKRLAREEKKEKRKTKMPKSVKKSKTKVKK
jgi:RIO kinase 1